MLAIAACPQSRDKCGGNRHYRVASYTDDAKIIDFDYELLVNEGCSWVIEA